MATSHHFDASEDFTVCPICFEKFQTPRFLPCTHTFCHRCLSAHIQSSCKDCDPALGFPCPVCQAFVPAPGVLRQYPIEDWASRFKENLFLSSCIRKHTSVTNILCGPCKIDCDIDIKAESWCVECEDSLCERCSQNHRKYKALQTHQVLPITNCGLDYTKSLKQLETDILKCCEKHENRNIEFVCGTHQTGCCSLCIVNEHMHCEKISTLLKAVDTFSDETKVKLVQEIKDLISKIETIVQKEKQNVSDIDDKKDILTEKITKMIEEMVNRLKTQEKTYLDKLAEVSKHARQKLEGSLRLLEHRKLYLTHWLEKIVSTDSSNKETEHVLNCLKTNKVLEAVNGLPLIQMNFDLRAEVSCGVEKIISLGTLFSAKLTENNVNFIVIQNETTEGKLETPNSSISNAKKSSEWFSCSGKAKKSRERESCSIGTEDSREWDSSSQVVDKSYECDVRSKKAGKSCDWEICPEKAEISWERDSCSKKSEISREWNSGSEKEKNSCKWDSGCEEAKLSSERTSGSEKGKRIYREWNSSFEATDKSCVRDSDSKKVGKSHDWDSRSKGPKKSCDWDKCSEDVEKSRERDKCSETAEKPCERDPCSKKAEISREWYSSSEKWGKSCKWDSDFEEGKISSEWNSDSEKGKKPYREWNSGFKANKSYARDSPEKVEKFHEWDSRSKKAEKSCNWDICSEDVKKSRERDICTEKSGISREWNSSSEKAKKKCKWDSGPEQAKISSKWDSGSEKGKKIYREGNSGFEATDKSCVRDSDSKKVEKSHEWDKCSKEAEKSCDWDKCSEDVEKSRERDICSKKPEKSCERD